MPFKTRHYVSFAEPATPLGRIRLCVLSNSSWSIPPEKMLALDHYIISYLIEGTGLFGDQFGFRCATRPGDLVCKFPGVKHYSVPTGNGVWTRLFIAFEGPVFDLWQEHGLLDPRRPIVHLEPVGYWLGRMQQIVETHEPFWQGRSLVEISRLQEFLADAFCHRESGGQAPADRSWLAEVSRMVEETSSSHVNLRHVARKLGISYTVFRNRFTKLTGVPPGRFRMLRLIKQASQLLLQSRLTNKEIANQLGFADEFHFSRRFKKATGQSPREFRTRFRLSGPIDVERLRAAAEPAAPRHQGESRRAK